MESTMPTEGIRSSTTSRTPRPNCQHRIKVQGRTVRIHLGGVLDRPGATRLIRSVNHLLIGGRCLVVLDATELVHLDYRCVGMLVRWQRGLRSFGHRLILENWNDYLRTILAMEDWDGELERRTLGPEPAGARVRAMQVQAP
ncbi:STAS domain-containing protein [bacterium]|nr:STAS domain-containing protein [bacterium]